MPFIFCISSTQSHFYSTWYRNVFGHVLRPTGEQLFKGHACFNFKRWMRLHASALLTFPRVSLSLCPYAHTAEDQQWAMFPSGVQTRANGFTSVFIEPCHDLHSLSYYMLWLRGKKGCRVMMMDSKNTIWLWKSPDSKCYSKHFTIQLIVPRMGHYYYSHFTKCLTCLKDTLSDEARTAMCLFCSRVHI